MDIVAKKTDGITIPADKINLQESIIATIKAEYPRSDIAVPVFNPTTNCRNCGAPLDRNKDCPYCGTKAQMRSGITMSSDSISFFAG